jgi:hypothetical protein
MCGELVSQFALVMDIVKQTSFIFDIPQNHNLRELNELQPLR